MIRKKKPAAPPHTPAVALEVTSWSIESTVEPVPSKPAQGRRADGETMAPTLGRILHYWGKGDVVAPAMVVGVHTDEMTVDLAVFGAEDVSHRIGVPFGGELAAKGSCYWPPR